MRTIFDIKKIAIGIGVALIGGFLFQFLAGVIAQQTPASDVVGATLLKEYFLPVQALAPIEQGKIVITGNECLYVGTNSTLCKGNDVDPKLGYGPVINSTVGAKKTANGLLIEKSVALPVSNAPTPGQTAYALTVTDPNTYQLRLTAKDAIDSLSGLTRNQYEKIKSQLINYPFAGNTDETVKELAFRQLQFRISVFSQTTGLTSVITDLIKIKDTTDPQFGAVDLGVLQPGSYTLFVDFVNDVNVTYPHVNDPCSDALACQDFTVCMAQTDGATVTKCQVPNADGNADGILDKMPVIQELAISKTQLTNDVVGVRIYTNPDHLSAQDWYFGKLKNPGIPVPTTIDGYRGVLDGRTAYINAANVINDSTRADAGVFYTNIYVIAYNQNASPATINIFTQLVNNWKFNNNLIEGLNDLEAMRIKNQLRRDTKRLEDINYMRLVLEDYHSKVGKYPDLGAGTFDPGHVISTWPTWQTVLAQQLGAGMPVDPLNEMALLSNPSGSAYADAPRQFNCQDPAEKASCENVCIRDKDQKAVSGCLNSQQCVGADYCSIIPAGYDAQTGWNQTTQKLYFKELPKKCVAGNQNQGQSCANDAFCGLNGSCSPLYAEGSYNTNGAQFGSTRFNDDAFVYQYTSVEGGKRYILNYRLEFQGQCTKDNAGNCTFSLTKCLPGGCYLSEFDSCLGSGAGVFGALQTSVVTDGTCSAGDAGKIGQTCQTDAFCGTNGKCSPPTGKLFSTQREAYRNQYCFAGSIVNSCGNGIAQPDAGEDCEISQTIKRCKLSPFGVCAANTDCPGGASDTCESGTNYCDNTYTAQNWYNENNINPGCTTTCRLITTSEIGQTPVAYNAQQPALSCGGFCGDSVTQFESKEQCDQGVSGGVIPLPKVGGSGGIAADSQYLCAAAAGTNFNTQTIAGCQSYGGYCGDATVQTAYGEQCDTASYVKPTPEQTVNQIQNGSFEQGFSNWQSIGADGTPKKVCSNVNGISTCTVGEQDPLKKDLIAFWSFDTVASGVTPDISGSTPPNNATVSNATVVDGISGKALQFNGNGNSGIGVGDNPLLRIDAYSPLINGTHPYTLSAWFKPRINVSEMTKYPMLFYKRPWPTPARVADPNANPAITAAPAILGGGYASHFSGTDRTTDPVTPGTGHINLQYCATDFCPQLNSTTAFTANNWYHYVGTYDGQFMRIYINGVLESTSVERLNVMGSTVGTNLGLASGFDGAIDQPMIYSRGLSADEVSRLYALKNNIPLTAVEQTLPSAISFEDRNVENIKSGSRAVIFKPDTQTPAIGQRVFYAAGSDITLNVWAKRIVYGAEASPVLKARFYNYDYINNVVLPFSAGGNCSVGSANDCYEHDLITATGNTTDIIDTYKLYAGTVTLPAATGAYLNNVTLAEIVSTTLNNPVIYLDSASISSSYRLQYGCGPKNNQSCQMIGGSCGDGITQADAGEECDSSNRSVCSATCKIPYCGDGVKGKMQLNGALVDEVCDASDPSDYRANYCQSSCSSLKLAGACGDSTDCGYGTVCAARSNSTTAIKHCTAGDITANIGKVCTLASECGSGATGKCTTNICTLLPGKKGCSSNDQCLDGFYCDLNATECLPRTDLYLQYHLNNAGFPMTNAAFGGTLFCPRVVSYQTSAGNYISKDACTGLEFRGLDLPINDLVSQSLAVSSCLSGGEGYSLPTAKQLFSLVSPNLYQDSSADGSSSYTSNAGLKLCSRHGEVTNNGGQDACLEGSATDNYIYWTNTPYTRSNLCKNSGVSCTTIADCNTGLGDDCVPAFYAVNFKNASLEVHPQTDTLKARCIGESACGNGTLERDEQCEFNTDGTENTSTLTATSCRLKGFDGGNVHCDRNTCRFRYDNCVAVTKPITATGKSCTQICNNIGTTNFNLPANTLLGRSVGTNIAETFPNRNGACTNVSRVCQSDADCGGNSGDCHFPAYTVANDNLQVTHTSCLNTPPNPNTTTGGATLMNTIPATSDGTCTVGGFASSLTPSTLCACDTSIDEITSPATANVIVLLDGILSEQLITYLSTTPNNL